MAGHARTAIMLLSCIAFMQGLWLEGRRKKLRVYMPRGAISPLKTMLQTTFIFEELLGFRLEFVPLIERETISIKDTRLTPFSTSHLDHFRSQFQKKYAGDFSAFCFLLERKKVRVGHSADLGKPEDLEPLFDKPLDLLVCELAHFTPEQILTYLKGKPVKRIAFVHVGESYRKDLPAIRRLAAKMLPGVEVSFPNDLEEIPF
jgi:ribonuclease BN (tRNA processing enzyme)